MKKKNVVVAMAILLLLSLPSQFQAAGASSTSSSKDNVDQPQVAPTSTPSPCNFPDVNHTDVSTAPESPHYFSQALYTLCPGVVQGDTDGLFHPYRNVTRGEFSKVTANLWSYTIPTSPPSGCDFTDISTSVFKGYIWAVCQHGIVTGYDAATCAARGLGNPCFGPNDNINRAQMAKFISLAMGSLQTPSGTAPHYNDIASGYWAYPFIESLYTAGVMGNMGSYYTPGALALRGETVYYSFNANTVSSSGHSPYYVGHAWARTYPNSSITGVSARKTVPHGNGSDSDPNSSHWAAGPIAVGYGNTFIESGPGSNLNDTKRYRSYINDSRSGDYLVCTVDLNSEFPYLYYSTADNYTTSWSAYACDPVCIRLGGGDLGVYSMDRVNSSAETSIKPENLGQTDTDTNVYTDTYFSAVVGATIGYSTMMAQPTAARAATQHSPGIRSGPILGLEVFSL